MAEVTLQNISKIYPDVEAKQAGKKAVENISFTVKDKEFMVIVGPSGCGKSTLLRMIAGLEDITEGTLLIDGKIMNHLSPRDRDIAMVFQNYALYPHMTVFENMAFGLKLKRIKNKEIKERVLETAKMLEIEDELFRKPKTLSGGQRQRVAIGRAIIRRPKVFLFDEPLSNLDAKLRSQMRIELQKLHKQIDATMIYVTHDQTEAMTLGNRIAVFNKGKLMQLDNPMNLYEHPANRFVGGFIGTPAMNFINGIIKGPGNQFISNNDELIMVLGNDLPKEMGKNKDKNITVGIRPEHIVLSMDNPGIDCTLIVSAIENMGNEQIIYLSFGKKHLIARRQTSSQLKIGNYIGVNFSRNKLMFMEEETGNVFI
jgi:multiple sugar transport system ATP-binding protein